VAAPSTAGAEDGARRIRRTGYERTFEEVIPRAGVRLTASWWETDGRSTLAE
jgi:hypothetical protein